MQTTLLPTRIDLPESSRLQLVDVLNRELAATLDLHSQVKQAHWNVKGPQFFARHELFDELAGKLIGFADAVAERVSTLGGKAEGAVRSVGARTYLPDYDYNAVSGAQHISLLIERYGRFASSLRSAITTSQKVHDPVTEDLFTSMTRGVELDLWFLESHMST